MMNADALVPVDDLIDDIGRDKFSKTALSEGEKDGECYSLPLYSHAQVMWYRKDLLEEAGLSVPKTWDEFAEAAKTLTKDGVFGCSFPCGSNDHLHSALEVAHNRSDRSNPESWFPPR